MSGTGWAGGGWLAAKGHPRVYPRIPGGTRRRFSAALVAMALLAGGLGSIVGGLLVADRVVTPEEPGAGDRPVAVPRETIGDTDPRPPGDPARSDPVPKVAEQVVPTVVRVDIGDPSEGSVGNGSGVIYGADGHIVTNNHVVEAAGELTVLFPNGELEEAEVVGTDELNDLAVLAVDRTGLDPIEIGSVEELRVGELAVAVGSPFGLEGTVTSGVISALDRGIDVDDPTGAPVTLPKVIQTDAPINPGNSGGPLVDRRGRLIGINSAILTTGRPASTGVGFAIPVDIVVDTAEELIAEGFVRHPFLGVEGETVAPERAAALGIDGGAEITGVRPGTPAAGAGLTAGDVIVAVDEVPVATMEELVSTVLSFEVGAEVEVAYRRGQESAHVDLVLGERPRQ